jgi:hypothetical protein
VSRVPGCSVPLVHPILDKAYRGVTKCLPPKLAGRLDLLRPSYSASWGGPLNGQERRQEIVRELARELRFDRVIETGTYRGTTTEFFSAVFGVPVATVEAHPRHFTYSSRRLAVHRHIAVEFGDSRDFLRRLAESTATTTETVFVYLDAHGEDDLPLAKELQIIAADWPRAVVMIDDFQVPGDSGYTYDGYGPGKYLVEEYLPAEHLQGWSLYYPVAESQRETGSKSGTCVLLSSALADTVKFSTLRLARSFDLEV